MVMICFFDKESSLRFVENKQTLVCSKVDRILLQIYKSFSKNVIDCISLWLWFKCLHLHFVADEKMPKQQKLGIGVYFIFKMSVRIAPTYYFHYFLFCSLKETGCLSLVGQKIHVYSIYDWERTFVIGEELTLVNS